MKAIYSILTLVLISQAVAAAEFNKIGNTKDIISEAKSTSLLSDPLVQKLRTRSPEMMRASIGSALNTKAVGVSAQAEWIRRLGSNSPVYGAAAIGYVQETKNNEAGKVRNYHHVPISMLVGYEIGITRHIAIDGNAGPTFRQIYERGNGSSQNQSYTYADVSASLGVNYQWSNNITGSGRTVGIRFWRLFGIADRYAASPLDTISATFGFDL